MRGGRAHLLEPEAPTEVVRVVLGSELPIGASWRHDYIGPRKFGNCVKAAL
jgi:hypothetical protein